MGIQNDLFIDLSVRVHLAPNQVSRDLGQAVDIVNSLKSPFYLFRNKKLNSNNLFKAEKQ